MPTSRTLLRGSRCLLGERVRPTTGPAERAHQVPGLLREVGLSPSDQPGGGGAPWDMSLCAAFQELRITTEQAPVRGRPGSCGFGCCLHRFRGACFSTSLARWSLPRCVRDRARSVRDRAPRVRPWPVDRRGRASPARWGGTDPGGEPPGSSMAAVLAWLQSGVVGRRRLCRPSSGRPEDTVPRRGVPGHATGPCPARAALGTRSPAAGSGAPNPPDPWGRGLLWSSARPSGRFERGLVGCLGSPTSLVGRVSALRLRGLHTTAVSASAPASPAVPAAGGRSR